MIYEFEFDTEDLRANREGRLTPYQQQRVDAIHQTRQQGARRTVIAFLIFIPILLGVGLLNEYLEAEEANFIDFLEVQLPIIGMMSGIFAVILGISAASQYVVSRAARQHRIIQAEGRAHLINLQSNWHRRYPRYELHLRRSGLNHSIFRFTNARPLRYFREGERYRVYYIPYYPLPMLLSAEVIDV